MKALLFSLITLIYLTTNGQELQNQCPPEFPHGILKIELFLEVHDSKYRQKSGTLNENKSQIQVVSNLKECKALKSFISEHKKYNEIDQKLRDEETIYFYKTSNFFYVFWNYKPEFYRPRMGSTKRFVVINDDFSQSWLFYL
ncbi:hypothetical protein [Psychroflexus sp. MES1-P1E]|uniref:hypothetical protein n=1 Tax=Psychroflexus sp. MES1-P1E TaxID=2058320 RepID=UPI000C7D3457|nr:hypothetical protein [Psychroflexus sp. MES1-P1E]PKG41188.1 hypothetical protein CXF67_16500 [Psychroflexus sp. MES1-P1E]